MLPGLLSGLAGLAAGVGAIVFSVPALAGVAALCALFAAGASALLLHRVRAAEEEAASAAALTSMRDLQLAAEQKARDVVDEESGLPDGRFFELALDSRVASGRRHLWPVTVVLLDVELGPDVVSRGARTEAVRQFVSVLRRTLREADIACRTGPATFALLLEDTSEEGGVWTAERLQIALARGSASRGGSPGPVRRLAVGVAAYPSHGLAAEEILARARGALARACRAESGSGLGQVEVARADLS